MYGHMYKLRKDDQDLLPTLKIVEVSESIEQVPKVKNNTSSNNCKDVGENDDKVDIKRAA
jgi:hypothetical protein